MNKKKITLIVTILSIVFIIIASTYAFWIWTNNDKKVSFITSSGLEKYIVYDEGNSYFVGDFQPKDSFCESVNTTISFYKKPEAESRSLYATIYMDINSIGTNIASSSSVYWVITKGDNTATCSSGLSSSQIINYGNFNDVSRGDLITLAGVPVTTMEQKFTIWIWIDGAGSNLSNLEGETVDTSVWTEIYEGNIKPETPRLDPGMIPVTISSDGTVTTVLKNDSSWYDYDNQEWANVVLVNSSSRDKYQNTTGIVINNSDILGHYVWIPRYKYKKTTCGQLDNISFEKYPECYGEGGLPYIVSDEDRQKLINYFYENNNSFRDLYTLEFVTNMVDNAIQNGGYLTVETYNSWALPDFVDQEGFDIEYSYTLFLIDNYVPNAFDIVFENETDARSTGNAISTYYTHPAFWWNNDNDSFVDNNEMLAGIWVGKFETTGSSTSPTIISNATTLYNQTVSAQFNTAKLFSANNNIYGLSNLSTNAHMMKNSEWGAVAYFTHSKYGVGGEVRINNNSSFKTGCGASSENGPSTSTCQIQYGKATQYPQSTTGNISGIFDMSGGAYEHTMGNYNNNISNAGFTSMPKKKYYDLYTTSTILTSCTLSQCGGHALYETNKWYGDATTSLNNTYSWTIRGATVTSGATAGLFAANQGSGVAAVGRGFRSVIINGFGE